MNYSLLKSVKKGIEGAILSGGAGAIVGNVNNMEQIKSIALSVSLALVGFLYKFAVNVIKNKFTKEIKQEEKDN